MGGIQYNYLTPDQVMITSYNNLDVAMPPAPFVHDFTAFHERSDILQARCPVFQATRSLAGREYPDRQISKGENKESDHCTFNLSTNLR